jgi:AraC-like DNA-binding protein
MSNNSNKKLNETLKETIRNKFVQGIEENNARVLFTLDALAEEYQVAKSTLYRHAKNEHWKMQQEQFQKEYITKLDEERQKTLVNESKKFDSNTLNISKALLQQIGRKIQQASEENNFTPDLLNKLAEATIRVQRVAKLALGESTDNMSLNARVQDTSAFREAMELLDEVAEQRREVSNKAVH